MWPAPARTRCWCARVDASALAKAINEVLASPARRSELVAHGRERAEHLSMSRLADAYVDYYRGAIH